MAQHTEAVQTNGSQFDHTPLEKDYSNRNLPNNMESSEALRRIRTAGSISISPELFEKIYLSPQTRVAGQLRKTFGNPTPVAVLGFLISLSPLSCDLMGWRGAGGNGAAGIATYYFFGGLLMLLGGIGEWILGNTFPFVVFCSFGAFWLGFAGTLQPTFNAYGAYSTTGNPADGLTTVGFQSSFAFFLLAMGLLCLVYFVLALRTNVAFVIIFLTLTVAFCLQAGAYWQFSNGNVALGNRMIKAAGATTLVTCASGWWVFIAIMLASVDFPFELPVGDLSNFLTPMSEKKKRLENMV